LIKKAFGLLWIAVILISASSAMAIQIPYPIYGYIKDSNGKPTAGVTVTVREAVTGQTKVDVTDELGRYSVTLDNYRDGDEVQITAGNAAVTRAIDIRSGGIQVDLNLLALGNSNSNYMLDEAIAGLPNWVLIAIAMVSSSLGFTSRIMKAHRLRAHIPKDAAQIKL
jgi:hypothetical protein